jgi:hypothetical protein
MGMYIGDVYIPAVEELNIGRKQKKINEIKALGISEPVILEHFPSNAREARLRGYLFPSGSKDAEDFMEDLLALVDRSAGYNFINFNNHAGFLSVENVDAPISAKSTNLIPFTLNGKFLPRTVYQAGYSFTNEIVVNDFGIGFPAVIPLPVGAYNVRLKSPWQIIDLSSYWAKITGKDGDIPFYKPFPLFDQDNASTTGDITYLEEAYRLQTINLDAQGEYAQWTTVVGTDIPQGTYKVVIRVRDDNVADDIKITISGSVSGTILTETLSTGGTDFTLLESSEFNAFTDETLTIKIEKATTTVNLVEIDYCYLKPTYTAKLLYDVVQEHDVGEVKVYDTMGSSDESQWVRVYSKEHEFVGDCVVENGLIRWVLNQTVGTDTYVWDGTTWVKTAEILLGWVEFEEPKVLEITPDYVDVEVRYGSEIWRVRFGRYDMDCKIVTGGSLALIWATGTAYAYYGTGNIRSGWAPIEESTQFVDTPFVVAIPHDGSNILYVAYASPYYFNRAIRCTATDGRIMLYEDYQTWYANLFKEAESATLSTAPDPLTYTDDFSSDTSARYAILSGTGVSWDTVNGVLKVYSDTETEGFVRLRSLKFADGTYSVDVKMNSTNAVDRAAWLVFGYQDSDNYYFIRFRIDSTGAATIDIRKRLNGVVSVLASASVTATTGTWYNLKVEWNSSTGTIDAYFDNAATPTVSAIDTSFASGNVGLKAIVATAGVGNLDVEFDNLSITATEVVGRGAQVNRFIDDFDWDSSAEYSGDVANYTWDATNGVITHGDGWDNGIVVNALKWGTGTIKVKYRPVSQNASGYCSGQIVVFAQDATNPYNNTYLISLRQDLNLVKIAKSVGGTETVLAFATYTLDLGKWYEVEVHVDSSTGNISVYIDGSLVVSATDTTFTSGYVGLRAGLGTVEFDDLEINAEEVTSSGNSCVIAGGLAHGGYNTNWIYEHLYLQAGSDIPLGRYLVVVRVKGLQNSISASKVQFKGGYNNNDGVSVTIDESGWILVGDLLNNDYKYLIRAIAIDNDDLNDQIAVGLATESGFNVGATTVLDYFLLIPISGLESETLMPQDIAFFSMVNSNLTKILEVRSDAQEG